MALINVVLTGQEQGSVVIHSLEGYQHEGYVYYHIKYTYIRNGETKVGDSVYRYRFGSATHYYNLSWGSDNSVLVQKDTFYDAVEYGRYKNYEKNEIDALLESYYSK